MIEFYVVVITKTSRYLNDNLTFTIIPALILVAVYIRNLINKIFSVQIFFSNQ